MNETAFGIITTKRGDETVIHRTVIIALRGFAVLAALMVGATSVFAANEPQNTRRRQVSTSKHPADHRRRHRHRRDNRHVSGPDRQPCQAIRAFGAQSSRLSTDQWSPRVHPHSRPLAQAGMRFTQAWTQPFCSPTRTSILTGLYSAKTGVLDYNNWLSQNHRSFVRDLKEKGGYSTALFGKYHMAGLGNTPA